MRTKNSLVSSVRRNETEGKKKQNTKNSFEILFVSMFYFECFKWLSFLSLKTETEIFINK